MRGVLAFLLFLFTSPKPRASTTRDRGKEAIDRALEVCRQVAEGFHD